MKKILFFLVFSGLTFLASAQRGWEAGPWAGIAHYYGDLNTSYSLGSPGAALGFIARYNFNKRLCLKFSGNHATVSADDADSDNQYERARNLSFRSPIWDGTAQFEFNFLTYTHGSKDEFYTPYLFAGLSAVYFNPQAEYNDEWVDLRPLGTEGQFRGEEYYTVTGGLTYGIGIKVDLSYEWSINVEAALRHPFSDYLDDVSTVYADKDDIEKMRDEVAVALSDRSIIIPGVNEGELSQPGRQRGNSKTNDSYILLGVGLIYYFGDLRCPPYSR